MLKKRITTLSITFALFMIYVCIGSMHMYGTLGYYPRFARAMLVFTMIYTMGGCMLQTAGFRRIALALGIATFMGLCVCFVYCVTFLDFSIFALCMLIILTRSTTLCDCGCANKRDS